MKHRIFYLATVLVLAACQQELDIPEEYTLERLTVDLVCEDGSALGSVDKLLVFDNRNEVHLFEREEGNRFATDEWPQGLRPGRALSAPEHSVSLTGEGLRIVLPHVQTIGDSAPFDTAADLLFGSVEMAANGLYRAELQRACGMLQLQIDADDVKSVTLTGNDHETLAGAFVIDDRTGELLLEQSDAGGIEAVTLVPRATDGKYERGTYCFCLPSVDFEKGFRLTLTDTSDYSAFVLHDEPLSIGRSRVTEIEMPAEGLEFGTPVYRDVTSPLEIDFSRVGYHWGECDYPDYPVVATLTPPEDGSDATDLINKAVSSAPTPGVVLLKAGTYNISGQISIKKNGIILRGEVDKSVDDPKARLLTTLLSTDQSAECKTTRPTFVVLWKANSKPTFDESTKTPILLDHIPTGAMSVPVVDPSLFNAGDRIVLYRPDNAAWVHDLGMDAIPGPGGIYSWYDYGHTFELAFERTIVDIRGHALYLDNPVPMDFDACYGGGYVMKTSLSRVAESGIEWLNLDSKYASPTDEAHKWRAVKLMNAEHCWVHGVCATHFAFGAVEISGYSRNITVEDCHCYEPVSQIDGQRRYAFSIGAAQLCLVRNCTADQDRHQFVSTNNDSAGPNVFLYCSSTRSYSNAGPHAHWATCFLYDNVQVDNELTVEDAQHWGYSSGAQGWQGTNHVFWNCKAGTIVCQSPQVTGTNWAWGCTGTKRPGSLEETNYEGSRPDGNWQSHNVPVSPQSLYEYQLQQRLAEGSTLEYLLR